MKRLVLATFIISVFILNIRIAFSQGDVISPEELAKTMIVNKNVIIVSARLPEDYNKTHIKGDVNVWHQDLYKEDDTDGLLKDPKEIAKILGKKGISENKTIVIYDDGNQPFAGRLYWIFDYLGCKNVKILNGHLSLWRKERMPLTMKPSNIPSTTFNASPDNSKIAFTTYIKMNLHDKDVLIVDTRSKDKYSGVSGITERKGHIPSAINFDYKNLLNENGTIKSKDEILKLVKDAGLTPDKEIILYCDFGINAGIVYMVLKSMLNFPKVRVYDGGFVEWESHPENLVEK